MKLLIWSNPPGPDIRMGRLLAICFVNLVSELAWLVCQPFFHCFEAGAVVGISFDGWHKFSELIWFIWSKPYHSWEKVECYLMTTRTKMIGGTQEVHSDNLFPLFTFNIWPLTSDIWHLNIWTFEHLNIWTFGHLKIWRFEDLKIWRFESFEDLKIWKFEHWTIGAFEHWIIGLLDYWNIGTLEHWNNWHLISINQHLVTSIAFLLFKRLGVTLVTSIASMDWVKIWKK